MHHPGIERCIVVVAVTLSSLPAAAEPLSLGADERRLGIVSTYVEDSLSVNGTEGNARGAMVGLGASLQRGVRWHGEASVLRGSLEYDAGARDATDTATLFRVRGSWGTALGDRGRLYVGAGFRRLSGDSPFGDGDGTTSSAYVPVGYTRHADFYDDWRVAVSVEGQLVLATRASVDDIPNAGNADFDSNGGAGLRVAADFRADTGGLTISTFLRAVSIGDSDTERVNGTDAALDDQRSTELGIAVHRSL